MLADRGNRGNAGDKTPENSSMEKIMLTSEVAKQLRISKGYLRELIRKNKIKAYKEGRRKGYRINEKAVQEHVNKKHGE